MRYVLTLVALLQLGCHSSSPTEPTATTFGRLSGVVKIGPNCPVEQVGNPCPTPPDAYKLRKTPAKYLVDLKGVGIDRTGDLPKVVEIHANSVTTLNVNIDTGLR